MEFVSDGSKRPGQRVVIYPPELEKLATVISTNDARADSEYGHGIACERILSASESFDNPPKFFPSDHENFEGFVDPPKVAEWMNLSSQIATAGRRQVAEDGPDTCSSDSDSDTEQHGDVILDGYVGIKTDSNGNPISSGHRMSTEQAEALRRASNPPPEEVRKATPVNSDNEDQGEMSEDQKRQQASARRRTGKESAPSVPQESSHSMSTRSQVKSAQKERVAGGARVTAGSGEKDTRATKSRPSKT
jgi:hypothetical protein